QGDGGVEGDLVEHEMVDVDLRRPRRHAYRQHPAARAHQLGRPGDQLGHTRCLDDQVGTAESFHVVAVDRGVCPKAARPLQAGRVDVDHSDVEVVDEMAETGKDE